MKVGFAFAWSAQPLTFLTPFIRRLLLIVVDALLLPLAVWLSFWLRLANPVHPNFIAAGSWMLFASFLVGLPLYAFTGQYKGLTRYVGSAVLYRLACRNGLLVLFVSAIGLILRLPMPPRSSWILLWLLLTGFTGAVRFALRDVLLNLRSTQHKHQLRVAIYGAGEAGAGSSFAFGGQPQDCHLPRRQPGLLGSFDQRGCNPAAPEIDRNGGLH